MITQRSFYVQSVVKDSLEMIIWLFICGDTGEKNRSSVSFVGKDFQGQLISQSMRGITLARKRIYAQYAAAVLEGELKNEHWIGYVITSTR